MNCLTNFVEIFGNDGDISTKEQHEVKGLLFGKGIQWWNKETSDYELELHYGAYDGHEDFLDHIKQGMLGQNNDAFYYCLVRFGDIHGTYNYYPLPLLVQHWLDGTITRPQRAKLNKVCKLLGIAKEDIK